MEIMIIGAGGQLGRELQRLLSGVKCVLGEIPSCYAGARVACTDRDTLDITDARAVDERIGQGKYDVIFNCAAMTNVDGCETQEVEAMRINAIGPRNLASAARRMGAKLVQVSTDYVFSGDADRPYVEWDICAPRSVYGKSKLLGEQYTRERCAQYFIVRTAWLYGRGGKNFVNTILSKAKTGADLKVVDDQRGNPTNAEDLAFHLLALAATEEYGVYHCTGNGVCSWYEFARKIVEIAGLECSVQPCRTQDYPSPAKRPAYSVLDNMMLQCTVGDRMRGWEDALRSFIEAE